MEMDRGLEEFTRSIQMLHEKRIADGARGAAPDLNPEVVARLLRAMRPVVRAMIDGDALLSLQSEPSRQFPGFYISYANTHPYHIVVHAAGEDAVTLRVTVSQPPVESVVYAGPLDEQAIRQALIASLSAWYKALD